MSTQLPAGPGPDGRSLSRAWAWRHKENTQRLFSAHNAAVETRRFAVPAAVCQHLRSSSTGRLEDRRVHRYPGWSIRSAIAALTDLPKPARR
jgi:hypothetical protein